MKEEKDKGAKRHFDIPTIILSLFLLGSIISFFYLLAQKTQNTFGFPQIMFSIVLSILIVLALVWLKHYTKINPYLALTLGIVALATFIYSVYIKYTGTYTNIFAIVFTIGILAYILYYFSSIGKVNLEQKKPKNLEIWKFHFQKS